MSRLYLASPYGFAESTKPFLEYLKKELRAAGHEVIDPWEIGEKYLKAFRDNAKGIPNQQRISELQEINSKLASLNCEEICKSDVVVACLDGPDVDSGTASEIGFACAMGKRIFGYRGDFRRTGENEAAQVNMQVQYWIKKSQGEILRTVDDLIAALNRQNSRLQKRRLKKLSSGKG